MPRKPIPYDELKDRHLEFVRAFILDAGRETKSVPLRDVKDCLHRSGVSFLLLPILRALNAAGLITVSFEEKGGTIYLCTP